MKGTVEPNVLYDVELKPMHQGNGYVVVSAQRTLFEARFETVVVPKTTYQVRITFGHKTIFFDPKDGKSVSSTTVDGVLNVIACREDIFDKEGVMFLFRKEANALLAKMGKGGRQLNLFD
jgi:hypothetical protein